MRALLGVLAAVSQLVAFHNACAHGDHKPKWGGIMGRGDDDVSIELVMEKDTVALYVEGHDGPLPTKTVKGMLILIGPGRATQAAPLIPAGDNKLTATGLKPIPGDRLRAEITLPNGDEVSSTFTFR